MVAAKLANLPAHRPPTYKSANLQTFLPEAKTAAPPVSQEEAARLLNVGPRSVARATEVRDRAVPELAAKVERGTVSVSAAADVAKLPIHSQSLLYTNTHKYTDGFQLVCSCKTVANNLYCRHDHCDFFIAGRPDRSLGRSGGG